MTAGDYWALAGMLAGFVGLPGSIIIMMLSRMSSQQDLFRSETRAELKAMDGRMNELERTKVGKQDWLREAVSTREKVDKVAECVARIDSRLEGEFGTSAAMNRLAESVERVLIKVQK